MTFSEIKELKDRIMVGGQISRDEAIRLSQTPNIGTLYYSANQLRAKFCGFKAEICSSFAIIDGQCSEKCAWCPVSSVASINYASLKEFNLEKTLSRIEELNSKGIKNIELNINRNALSQGQLQKMIDIIKQTSTRTSCKLCASLGNLSYENMKLLKEQTQVTNYHCNIETSERHFEKLCMGGDIHQRYETIKNAQKVGFEVCSGGIIGMGESMEDRIDMALKIRELGIRSITINILFAFNGTPLEKHPPLGSQEILTTIAIFRFINPKARIRLGRGKSQIKIIEKDAVNAGINSSLAGEILIDTMDSDIESDKKLFLNEGFNL